MPKFHFVCPDCSKTRTAIGAQKLKDAKFKCECGGEMKRGIVPPSTRVVERLDNGAMSRACERLSDIERIMYDRAHLPEDRGQIEFAGKPTESPEE